MLSISALSHEEFASLDQKLPKLAERTRQVVTARDNLADALCRIGETVGAKRAVSRKAMRGLESYEAGKDIVIDAVNDTVSKRDRMFAYVSQLSQRQFKVGLSVDKMKKADRSALKPLEDKMQSLQTTVSGLEKAVNGLEKTNVDVLRDSKNFQADSRMKMQKDLDKYQKLFADDVFAPLLTDMAKIYINCWKCINALEDEKIRNNLEGLLLESMEELFEDNGVEINQTAVGTARSLRTCKTRKTVPTGDEALHGAVALSLNPSFSLGRLVLVKEVVDTFVFDPALKPAEQEEAPVEPEAVPTEPEEIIPAEDNTTAE